MCPSDLCCPQCHARAQASEKELVRRLREIGLLRRAPNPPEELIAELLAASLERLTCDKCGAVGLLLQDEEFDEWDDWQQAVVCEICSQPIPPERLEVFPAAKRCVGCQNAADRGEESEEPDYCPKCGSLVELRVSRGSGTTRYKLFCTGDPPCRL